MIEKVRVLFLSANPWTTSRILVHEEAREVFERLQEGPYRARFELYNHGALRASDLQRLLMLYEPHVVHFSGHTSRRRKLVLGATSGRSKQINRQGLVEMLALYTNHLRLVFLNACFSATQARSLSKTIDYAVGTEVLRDKTGVKFAGAFYRALAFGKSVKEAFASAKAELGLIGIPLPKGMQLFVRNGINKDDSFPIWRQDITSSWRESRPQSIQSDSPNRDIIDEVAVGRHKAMKGHISHVCTTGSKGIFWCMGFGCGQPIQDLTERTPEVR